MPFAQRRQNILLCGVDANSSPTNPWAGARTDTIILLNIDPKTKSINAISIPRDSKVYLPGDYGIQKSILLTQLAVLKWQKPLLKEP